VPGDQSAKAFDSVMLNNVNSLTDMPTSSTLPIDVTWRQSDQ